MRSEYESKRFLSRMFIWVKGVQRPEPHTRVLGDLNKELSLITSENAVRSSTEGVRRGAEKLDGIMHFGGVI